MEQTEINQATVKNKSNRNIFIVLAVAVLLFLCFCCASFSALMFIANPSASEKYDDTQDPNPYVDDITNEVKITNYGAGEVADLNGLKISVDGFDSNYEGVDKYYTSKKEGKKRVSVLVHMTNESRLNVDFSFYDFAIKDDDNYKYTYLLVGRKTPTLDSGLLNPGDEVEGWITFEVPDDSSGYILQYTSPSTGEIVKMEI